MECNGRPRAIAKNKKIRLYTFLCLSNVRVLQTICGETVPEIHVALYKMCEMDTIDRSSIQRWHQRFCDGHISIFIKRAEGCAQRYLPRTSSTNKFQLVFLSLINEIQTQILH